MTIKDPSIVDVLRDNQKLIPESIEVRHMKLTGGAHGFEVGDPVPSSEYTIETPTKDNNNTLTIHFKNEIKTAYHISFKTSLVGEQINKRYDNYADLKDDRKLLLLSMVHLRSQTVVAALRKQRNKMTSILIGAFLLMPVNQLSKMLS